MQHGMLRFYKGVDSQQRMQVRTSADKDDFLNCVIHEDENATEALLNREVVLIQKDKDDYLYLTGLINDEIRNGCKVVSLKINKACWFIKKKRGSVVWLQQKYMFENPIQNVEKAS